MARRVPPPRRRDASAARTCGTASDVGRRQRHDEPHPLGQRLAHAAARHRRPRRRGNGGPGAPAVHAGAVEQLPQPGRRRHVRQIEQRQREDPPRRHVLDEEQRPAAPRRETGPAPRPLREAVLHRRAGPDLQTVPPAVDAPRQIEVLQVEEEQVVEAVHLLEHPPRHEQVAARETLHGDPPGRRVEHRPLGQSVRQQAQVLGADDRAVVVDHRLSPDAPQARVVLAGGDQPRRQVGIGHHRIVVQEPEEPAPRQPRRRVPRVRRAAVPARGQQADRRVRRTNALDRPVAAAVVDDQDLERRRPTACRDPRQRSRSPARLRVTMTTETTGSLTPRRSGPGNRHRRPASPTGGTGACRRTRGCGRGPRGPARSTSPAAGPSRSRGGSRTGA